jgi:flagellar motor switch/type III secretory pathway protein FliN
MVMAAPATARPPGEAGVTPANPPAEAGEPSEDRWKPALGLRCELTVDLPLPAFKIADLVQLRQGSVINAHWRVGQDVPLRLNATLIGWIEFEVVGGNLAVRLTELA